MSAEAVAVEVAPPRPGTKAYLQAQIRAMREEVQAARDTEHDINHLVNAIYKEALRRGWCGDYEVFVRFHNGRLKKPRLIPRNPAAERATQALGQVVTGCGCAACEENRRVAREAGLL